MNSYFCVLFYNLMHQRDNIRVWQEPEATFKTCGMQHQLRLPAGNAPLPKTHL